MSSALKTQLQDAMKAAMKGGDKETLAVIRLMLSALKQIEVDERIALDNAEDNARIVEILDKMVKQRRESIGHFDAAGRDDLSSKEKAEIEVIQTFLPQALCTEEIETIVRDAINATGATSIKDMGKVMAIVKPMIIGRADMGEVSSNIKALLNAG